MSPPTDGTGSLFNQLKEEDMQHTLLHKMDDKQMELLTTNQVAMRLEKNPRTIRQWLAKGFLAGGVKKDRQWFISPVMLGQFITAHKSILKPSVIEWRQPTT